MYAFEVFDLGTNALKEGIMVAFIQVLDKIELRYRKLVFDVMSVSDDLIILEKDGIKHFIKRTNFPFK